MSSLALPAVPVIPEEVPVSDWLQNLQKKARKGTVGFFRQSTPHQKHHNLGSQKAQEAQLDRLHCLGIDRSQVRILLAYGESGREGVVRQRFAELVDMVRANHMGLVVLAKHDRLSRNLPDAADFFALAAAYGVFLMVDGRVYDPSDPGDMFILTMFAAYAELENRVRARWTAVTRLARARALELRIALPAGLVWADIDDPEYQAKAREAGLGDWLDQINPVGPPKVRFDGRILQILPLPDRDVARALHLIRDWLLETQDIFLVEQRIRAGYQGWPRPGQFPASRSKRPFPDATIEWVPLTISTVYDFLRSPAPFGTYQYRASSLAHSSMSILETQDITSQPAPQLRRKTPPDVQVRDAFRSWFPADEEPLIRQMLTRQHARWEFNPDRPRSVYHAVDYLRCAYPIEPGRLCRRRLKAYMALNGHVSGAYVGNGCRHTKAPHFVHVSIPVVDENVIDILVQTFRPEALRDLTRCVQTDLDKGEKKRASQANQLTKAAARVDAAQETLIEKKIQHRTLRAAWEQDPQSVTPDTLRNAVLSVELWDRKLEKLNAEVVRLERELQAQRVRDRAYQGITGAELEQVMKLAADLPELLHRARGVPGALHRIVTILTREVLLHKRGAGIWELTVTFPSGASIVRLIADGVPAVAQPMRVWAYHRLAAGADAEIVANELTSYPGPEGRGRAPWSAEHIHGLALAHAHFEVEVPRDGEYYTCSELAKRTGQPLENVISIALCGRLGPARWSGGELSLCPTEMELHRSFQEYARTEVARVNGLAVDEVLPLSDVSRANRDRPCLQSICGTHVDGYYDAARRIYVLRSQVEAEGLETVPNRREMEEARISVAAAVQALDGVRLPPDAFQPLVEVVRQLGARWSFVTSTRVLNGVRHGYIPAVRCKGIAKGKFYQDLLYVGVPPKVWRARSADVVRQWLGGTDTWQKRHRR